jgi:hypothetical protein
MFLHNQPSQQTSLVIEFTQPSTHNLLLTKMLHSILIKHQQHRGELQACRMSAHKNVMTIIFAHQTDIKMPRSSCYSVVRVVHITLTLTSSSPLGLIKSLSRR